MIYFDFVPAVEQGLMSVWKEGGEVLVEPGSSSLAACRVPLSRGKR